MNNTSTSALDHQEANALDQEGINDAMFRSIIDEDGPTDFSEDVNDYLVNCAKLYSRCNIKEAGIKLELTRLANNHDVSAESAGRLRSALEMDLESVKASRKIGEICAALVAPRAEWSQAFTRAAAAADLLEEAVARETALAAEIAVLRERDIINEPLSEESLTNELGWIARLLESNEIRLASRDFQEEAIAIKLGDLAEDNKYHGELSREGADKRVAYLEEQIPNMQDREASALTTPEVDRLIELHGIYADATAASDEASKKTATLFAAAKELEESYGREKEIARIGVATVNEVHRINCLRWDLGAEQE